MPLVKGHLQVHIMYLYMFITLTLRAHTHTHTLLHRLQTGMRGAFGKPQGTVARVHIGQVIMSIRSKENYLPTCLEALRRAKFKYPGRQKASSAG